MQGVTPTAKNTKSSIAGVLISGWLLPGSLPVGLPGGSELRSRHADRRDSEPPDQLKKGNAKTLGRFERRKTQTQTKEVQADKEMVMYFAQLGTDAKSQFFFSTNAIWNEIA